MLGVSRCFASYDFLWNYLGSCVKKVFTLAVMKSHIDKRVIKDLIGKALMKKLLHCTKPNLVFHSDRGRNIPLTSIESNKQRMVFEFRWGM